MIRIHKPVDAPEILATRGVEQCRLDCAEFDSDKDNFLSGAKKMSEKLNKIYGAQSVKDLLLHVQHKKCCYCERQRGKIELDVEHFRPKGAVRQARGSKKISPGYYWLAYEWSNLYLACKPCNTSHKGILFPLADDRRRTRWHGDPNLLEDEEPLFINPGLDDPSDHLRYNEDAPEPKTTKGKITIKELRLASEERPRLKESRIEKIRELSLACLAFEMAFRNLNVAGMIDLLDKARLQLRAAVQPSAEFSLMAAHFIENYFEKAGILFDFLD